MHGHELQRADGGLSSGLSGSRAEAKGQPAGIPSVAAGLEAIRDVTPERSYRRDDPEQPVLDPLFWALRKSNLLDLQAAHYEITLCVPVMASKAIKDVRRVVAALRRAREIEAAHNRLGHWSADRMRIRAIEHALKKEEILLARLEAEHAG